MNKWWSEQPKAKGSKYLRHTTNEGVTKISKLFSGETFTKDGNEFKVKQTQFHNGKFHYLISEL